MIQQRWLRIIPVALGMLLAAANAFLLPKPARNIQPGPRIPNA
jgi:hypothetical protein